MTRHEATGMEIPPWTKSLKAFGEARVVKTGKDGKLGNRGITCMFVDYADGHSSNSLQMINPKKGRIIKMRNLQWLSNALYQ